MKYQYREGYEAFWKGAEQEANPYCPRSEEYEFNAWLFGWTFANEEYMEEKYE